MNEKPAMATWPHISVAIPTRNRPDDVVRCLDSLTRVSYPHWDILLLDQSDDTHTQEVAERYSASLPHLAYRRMPEPGVSRSRNAGTEGARGEIVAQLDDDCTVEPDWLEHVARVFARHPQAALVFGTVRAGVPDWSECYVPVYEVPKERVLQGRRGALHLGGLGASMYLSRSAWQRVGPFDIHLGPGAPFFRGSEENDYGYRCLAAGYSVVETPFISVRHYGTRDYKSNDASRLVRRYMHSYGAHHMKLLRSGDAFAVVVIAVELWRDLRIINLPNLLLRRGPSNIGRAVMYALGLCASFRLGVNRERCLYV